MILISSFYFENQRNLSARIASHPLIIFNPTFLLISQSIITFIVYYSYFILTL